MKNAIIQEMQVLQQVKSRNIVQVYDIMESTNNYYIVQELCDSDLEHYMRYNSSIP
jgi:serine/threonine protein kinase